MIERERERVFGMLEVGNCCYQNTDLDLFLFSIVLSSENMMATMDEKLD